MLYRDSPIDASMLALYTHQNIHLFANEIEELEVFSEVLSGTDELLVGESVRSFSCLLLCFEQCEPRA